MRPDARAEARAPARGEAWGDVEDRLESDRDDLRQLMKRYHQEHHAPYFSNPYADAREQGSTSQEDCGREPVFGQDVDLYEGDDGDRLYVKGLERCGSVWCCPSCARRVAVQKGEALEGAVESWRDHGGTVELVSLTFPHHQGQDAELLVEAMQTAWREIRENFGGWWDTMREGYDVEHYVQTTEITHGENGWHPHRHVLLFVGGSWSDEDRAQVEQELWTAWRSALVRVYETRRGELKTLPRDRDPERSDRTVLGEPRREYAVRIVPAGEGAGHYVSKMGLARELVRFDVKEGRNGNRTPWEILRDAALERDPDAPRLWREYIEAMHGRAHWYTSHQMRDDPRVTTPEQGELEIDLALKDAEDDERVATIGHATWSRLYGHHGDELLPTVKRVWRCGGWSDLAQLVQRLCDHIDARLRVDHQRRELYDPVSREGMRATLEGV